MGVQAECEDRAPSHEGRRGLAGKINDRHPLGALEQWLAATIRMMVHLVACLISVHGHTSVARPRELEPAGTSPRRASSAALRDLPRGGTVDTVDNHDHDWRCVLDGRQRKRGQRRTPRLRDLALQSQSHPILSRSSTLLLACSSRQGSTVLLRMAVASHCGLA